MSIKVAINGFGRIGRSVFRLASKHFPKIEIIAINDLVPTANLAYLLKYDSIHGIFDENIQVNEDGFTIRGKKVHVFGRKRS